MVNPGKFEAYVVPGMLLVFACSLPAAVSAQQLEEIVVTAQRRVQSLQEVPISIEAISGQEIQDQGYRNMEDLSFFSPSVFIQSGVQDQQVTVRGFGTIGNSLTLEQAVPIFLDGIHYGRQSQIKTAFLDVDRVEILKGPQPVYFGQNASAGAFNIESKKPTPSWEGDLNAEYGNNQTIELSFGAGGPLTDTLGIRVAGIREQSDGFLEHPVTHEKLPEYDNLGGRVTFQWAPTDNFTSLFKLEGTRLRNGSESVLGCITRGDMIFDRRGPQRAGDIGDERSIYKDPPQGSGFNTPYTPIADECFEGNVAAPNGGPYLLAPDNIREENSNFGSLDIREASEGFSSVEDGDGVTGVDSNGILGQDNIDTWTGMLNLIYTLDNGIEANWNSAYSSYWRNSIKDNSHSLFLMNYQNREEEFDQWSTELRFTSPAGGMIEWMAGASWQQTQKDNFSSSLRANVRRGQRFNYLWEDVEWQNAFATLTFNFLNNRASIDIGGRYSHIDKTVFIRGYGATWIYDIEPCDPGALSDEQLANPTAENIAACAGTTHPDALMVPADQARIYVDDPVDMDNLWTIFWRDSRDTPPNWLPSQARAVGLTGFGFYPQSTELDDPGAGLRQGPHLDTFTDNFFDPQVTLRWRPTDNHSLFFRWAKASKGAGYDTGQTSIPDTIEDMRFEAETGETFELGSKGTLFDGRARYDVTLFRTDFDDLQLSGLAPVTDQDETSISLNAGKQRVQGVEFGVTAAVTEGFTVGLNGALMDGEMVEFNGSGCNFDEFWNAELGLGVEGLTDCEFLDEEVTDRSGDQAPRTPDWRFVLTTGYTMPLWGNLDGFVNAKGYYSDGYITARESFTLKTKYNKHGDLNLSAGVAERNGSWKLSAYANNIFEARESYNGEFDVIPDGFETIQPSRSNFMTYGLRFNYNFR